MLCVLTALSESHPAKNVSLTPADVSEIYPMTRGQGREPSEGPNVQL